MIKDHTVAMPATFGPSRGVSCSRATQVSVTTSNTGIQCGLRFLRTSGSQTEVFTENAEGPRPQCETFPCHTCGLIFLSEKYHDRHWQYKHAEKPLGKYRCSRCPYSSDCSTNVTTHERTHTGERPFICQLCQKAFTQEGGLRRHHRVVHAKGRPHGCELCGQRFALAFYLARHRRDVHTRDGPLFACPECGRGFTREDNLNAHRRTHTGEKPHACTMCEMRFTQVGTMKRHQRMVHGFWHGNLNVLKLTLSAERPHACSTCGMRFTQVGSVKRHHKMVHGIACLPFPVLVGHHCPHCGIGLASAYSLKRHLNARHQGEVEDVAGESKD